MTYPYSQSYQPGSQRSQFVKLITSPWAAIVHRHSIWESVASESVDQGCLDSSRSFIGAGLEYHVKPRVIVNNRQWMTPALSHRKMAFKIHLPKSIGIGMLKPDESPMFRGLFEIDKPATVQDASDRRSSRNIVMSQLFQSAFDLAPAPRRVSLPKCHDCSFNRFGAFKWTAVRPSRHVPQSSIPVFIETIKPFIAGFPADAKELAQPRDIAVLALCQHYKLASQAHSIHLSPRHGHLLSKQAMPDDKCYLCP